MAAPSSWSRLQYRSCEATNRAHRPYASRSPAAVHEAALSLARLGVGLIFRTRPYRAAAVWEFWLEQLVVLEELQADENTGARERARKTRARNAREGSPADISPPHTISRLFRAKPSMPASQAPAFSIEGAWQGTVSESFWPCDYEGT